MTASAPFIAARSPVAAEIRATLRVAGPLAAANLSQIAMGLIDTVMVGSLGAVPLAAVGLAGGFYFTTVVICAGILGVVAPLAGFALGAGDRAAAGRVAGSGLVVAVLLVVPMVAAMLFADRLLDLVGYDPELTREIGRFLHAVAWGAPGFLGFAVLRSLFAALARARVVMIVLVLCVPANAGLNWLLIFGHLGLPQLGLVGAGYASAINQWLMLIGLVAAFAALPRDEPARRLRGRLAAVLADIRRILVLGLPIGGHQAMEIGVFVTSAGLMGLFGADALAAHQIVINCSSVTFMVPLGIGQAATVRIAIARGVGAPIAARRAGFVAMALGLSFMAAASLVLLILPRSIVAAYVAIDDPANRDLVALALQFMVVAAAFQIVDGMQTVAAGALRGYEDTTVPMLLAAFGYWAIGFVGGWALAFPLGLGPIGLWWGFLLGLAAVGLLLALRLWRRSLQEIRA